MRIRPLITLQRALPVALLALLASGCAHPIKKKLEGRWVGEAVENFDDDAMAVATGWAKGTSLEFAGSSLTVAIPAEEPRTAEFKIAKVHERDVQLSVLRKDGTRDKLALKLDDEHSMRWVLGGGRSIVMRRD